MKKVVIRDFGEINNLCDAYFAPIFGVAIVAFLFFLALFGLKYFGILELESLLPSDDNKIINAILNFRHSIYLNNFNISEDKLNSALFVEIISVTVAIYITIVDFKRKIISPWQIFVVVKKIDKKCGYISSVYMYVFHIILSIFTIFIFVFIFKENTARFLFVFLYIALFFLFIKTNLHSPIFRKTDNVEALINPFSFLMYLFLHAIGIFALFSFLYTTNNGYIDSVAYVIEFVKIEEALFLYIGHFILFSLLRSVFFLSAQALDAFRLNVMAERNLLHKS